MERCLFFLLILSSQVMALPTLSLDPTFGIGGRVNHALGQNASARKILLQPDGKLLVAGLVQVSQNAVRLVRFNADGSLDTTFGSIGQVTSTIHSPFVEAWHGAVLLSNGKILVGGNLGPAGSEDFAIARYNANGLLDRGFGQGGIVTLDFGNSSESINALAVQADGKIVAVGKSNVSHNEFDFVAGRFNADGSIDTAFASNGKFVLDRNSADIANSVIIQPDGKILIGGRVGPFCGVLRLNTNGTADTNFGTNGLAAQFSTSIGKDIALQRDGKILSVGDGMVRFNSNGSLDSSFGNAGRAILSESFLSAVHVRPDGLIVAAGNSASFIPGTDENFAVGLFNTNGSFLSRIDTDFEGHERAEAVLIQPNGAVLTAGFAVGIGTNSNFALARYVGLPRVRYSDTIIDLLN